LASDRVSLGATYFYTRLQRTVAFTGFAEDPLGLGRFTGYVNRPGGLARGIELSLDTAPTKGMSLRGGYTFTNSDRFVTGLGLQPEYVIPKHLVAVLWSQRYRRFLFSAEVNHTGSYLAPVFENNLPFRMAELNFDGYTKADVFGNYEHRISEDVVLTFFGGIENLFDQRYYENGFLAPGAVGRGGIKVRF
jgi:vitamin B12 transporter